jgi:hypothetical protein
VVLAAHSRGRWHQVVNLGAFIDPAPDSASG